MHNTYKTNKTICDHCSYVHVCRNKLDGMSSNIILHGMIEIMTSRSNNLTFHHSETSKRHINAVPTPKHIKYINFINMLYPVLVGQQSSKKTNCTIQLSLENFKRLAWSNHFTKKIRGFALQEPGKKKIYIYIYIYMYIYLLLFFHFKVGDLPDKTLKVFLLNKVDGKFKPMYKSLN